MVAGRKQRRIVSTNCQLAAREFAFVKVRFDYRGNMIYLRVKTDYSSFLSSFLFNIADRGKVCYKICYS